MRNALKTCCLLFTILVGFSLTAAAQDDHGHYYVPLRDAEMDIKDFNFPTLDGKTVNLREAVKGKKLVLVHYFAAWCHNSNFDVKTMKELYEKYKDQGFTVIGVCEYSSEPELRGFIERHQPEYTICIEGDGKMKDRTGTTHYAYRNQLDDNRHWGTPLNVLISAEDVQKKGDIIAKHVRIAPGEVIKSEFEELIEQRLKLKK
ncbi:MAG TPA: TlpA disulfide reductase family protein [Blastocatellia bacterium]|nr:TlpA disulfide reductase family protein [Blastocatellia bacterium]